MKSLKLLLIIYSLNNGFIFLKKCLFMLRDREREREREREDECGRGREREGRERIPRRLHV